MSEETIGPRLLAKLCEQSGTLSANVIELQLRLQDALAEVARLSQQAIDQGERIRNDMDAMTAIREERDAWRIKAEARGKPVKVAG